MAVSSVGIFLLGQFVLSAGTELRSSTTNYWVQLWGRPTIASERPNIGPLHVFVFFPGFNSTSAADRPNFL